MTVIVKKQKKIGQPLGGLTKTLEASIEQEITGRSLWADAIRRFFNNKGAVVSLAILVILIVAIIIGPWLSSYTIEQTDWSAIFSAPSGQHLFGTGELGRDLFVRTMAGGRVTLYVGFIATFVSIVIGILYGATAGFIGGKVDGAMMRIVDVLYSLPFLFFVILLMTFFGRNFILMFIAIGAISWLDMARIVRGQTLSLKSKEFIEAAYASGVSQFSIIIRHIVPNLLGVVVVYATLTVPTVILTAAFLSFLGLGVQAPMTSLGVLVNSGAQNMTIAWWSIAFPGAALALILYCFNFIGDGLRDALDPKGH
ncbi:Oligopeptide transport system permease protein OppC [Piscirickettsia salmonis]|uniref:Oligopeptide transport system permease protein OppC n=1 Tax=Piscirickettsia salmonis TaxID=1238 RepID=A0A1L6TE19_PISSA|nr:ABC transporter permease subunit [Piscirickettsia salmonis]AKP72798.2 peptide ABC transporter permease [Piscirickettsia salmonis LF-89 = ATCC VR-1361]ALB23687.1 peptide ABC transporter permease [Piscirickettsia salmonis]ALY03544.1 peptide ABC transporter permease [Piscirickettsia salmonis]AMA43110.1 peptide ABC transporter permease [Piscirickettsia salmonis]AOS35580.1 peptide ABC transporter permease [Piscirickettsia salmonis]